MKRYIWIIMGIIAAIEIAVGVFMGVKLFSSQSALFTDNDVDIKEPVYTLESTPSNEAPHPAAILDLTNWKLTLPIGKPKKSTSPLEILQPDLATYKVDPWFMPTSGGLGVIFRAPVVGPTTGNTKYARSELREMTDNGKAHAAWSSTQGIHSMFLDQAITSVPKVKQHVVAGQIHDDGDDVIVIRLEYPNLYVNVDGENVHVLDTKYTLGKRFTVKFEVKNGLTNIYYNGSSKPSYTLDLDYSGAYFKAGAYTQSSCEKEGSNALCTPDNYGEVTIYKVEVTHK